MVMAQTQHSIKIVPTEVQGRSRNVPSGTVVDDFRALSLKTEDSSTATTSREGHERVLKGKGSTDGEVFDFLLIPHRGLKVSRSVVCHNPQSHYTHFYILIAGYFKAGSLPSPSE